MHARVHCSGCYQTPTRLNTNSPKKSAKTNGRRCHILMLPSSFTLTFHAGRVFFSVRHPDLKILLLYFYPSIHTTTLRGVLGPASDGQCSSSLCLRQTRQHCKRRSRAWYSIAAVAVQCGWVRFKSQQPAEASCYRSSIVYSKSDTLAGCRPN